MSYDPEQGEYFLDALQYSADHNDVKGLVMLLESWQKAMGTPQGTAEEALSLHIRVMLLRPEDGVCFPDLVELVRDADVMWASWASTRLERQSAAIERGAKKRSAGQKKGAATAGANRTAKANATKVWLYPLLAKADAALIQAGKRQRGAQSLYAYLKESKKNAKDFRLNPTDSRRKDISIARIRDWIKAGRPDTA